jgi:hypothetical protein
MNATIWTYNMNVSIKPGYRNQRIYMQTVNGGVSYRMGQSYDI